MTDKMIPADAVREIIARHRDGASRRGGMILDDLKALLRPTLADMTDEERAACQRMQADVKGYENRAVIAQPYLKDGSARVMWETLRVEAVPWSSITPRPDLPRLEWPGTEEPAPAPALPEGWRLADHPHHGRVIVTRTEPDLDGEVAITVPVPTNADRARLEWCRPDELTYIDTAPAPSTFTEGDTDD